MSLMLKLLVTTLLLSNFVYANAISEKVEDFLSNQLHKNKNLSSIDVTVNSAKPLKELKGWYAYTIVVEATLKVKPKDVIKWKMIWFSDGNVITEDLINLQSAESFTEMLKPDFNSKYYTKKNLIYGSENARHKVVIFSDPLCPYCKAYVPSAIKMMRKEPNKYAIYYYHFPLVRLHPASVLLVKAAIVAEQKGISDVIFKLYNVNINPRERSNKKILSAFNKAVGTHITLKELDAKSVKREAQYDLDVANDMMVGGTPTVYLDEKIDKTKQKYKKVK